MNLDAALFAWAVALLIPMCAALVCIAVCRLADMARQRRAENRTLAIELQSASDLAEIRRIAELDTREPRRTR